MMNQLIILSMTACLGYAVPTGLLGEPGAIYGRLQRNSYVPYPKPDYTKLYLALKNARLADQVEPVYDYTEMRQPLGAIFEPQNEMFEYDADPQSQEEVALPNQQWLDIGTLYDTPIDEEGLEQQKEMVRHIMANFMEKKSEKKAAAPHAKPTARQTIKTTEAPTTTTTQVPTTSTSPMAKVPLPAQHKEDKVPQVSKLFGQKEYAMLRPAGTGDSRRPLPELWPGEDDEVTQLKRAGRRLYRKQSSDDLLTKELDKLRH